MKTCVLTNNHHLWLLRGFVFCFNRFWSRNHLVQVFGFQPPAFALPANFEFVSLGPQLPAENWTDGLLAMLEYIDDELVLLMLEDYWLRARVDEQALACYRIYMETHSRADRILRLDLSGNRASNRRAQVYTASQELELVSTPPTARYQMSFQAAIWNRELLQSVLVPGESPWQAEVAGSERLCARPDLIVLGAREKVLDYAPVYRGRRGRMNLKHKIPGRLFRELRAAGCLERS